MFWTDKIEQPYRHAIHALKAELRAANIRAATEFVAERKDADFDVAFEHLCQGSARIAECKAATSRIAAKLKKHGIEDPIEWLVSIDNLAVTNDDGCDFEDQLNYNLALNGMKPLALTDHFKLHRYIHLRYLAYERYLGEFPSGDIYFVSQHLADHLTTYFNDFPNNIKSQLVAFRNDLDAMKIGDEVSQWCKGAVEDWMTEHKTYLDAYANQQKMDAKTRSIMVNFVREVVKDTFGIGDSDAYEAAQKALKGVAGTLVNRQANALIFEKELLKTMALECGIHAQKNDIEAGDIVSCIQNR